MARVLNFSSGPAILPEEVLRQAQAELLDWSGRGCSVIESSHRFEPFVTRVAAGGSGGFYADCVAHPHRSRMNVPFSLRDERLTATFLAGAEEIGLAQLKGHRTVGGVRASMYNAMPVEGARRQATFMQDFQRRHG